MRLPSSPFPPPAPLQPRLFRSRNWGILDAVGPKNSHSVTNNVDFSSSSTLVYLEGDASMRSYVDGDGKKHTQLSLVQTKVEVLKRVSPGATETPTEDE